MKILLNGACGRMGKEMLNMLTATEGFELAGAVDKFSSVPSILTSLSDFKGSADVLIDFSHFSATAELTAYAVERSLPLIIATTGQTEKELALIKAAAEKIPVFFSANMSLGVALLIELAKKTASVFPDADIEIIETHHNRKLDAPSGTAKMIAEGIKQVRPDSFVNCGRSGSGKRDKNEIGISSVRMGNIVGIHEVLVSTDTQSITLTHQAYSRALFAEGALSAAKFIYGKSAGLYDMSFMVKD